MHSTPDTVDEYIAELPDERREDIAAVRSFIVEHVPKGYVEGIQYGMISYYVPLETYSKTYNHEPLSYIALASQKNYISLYLMAIYAANEEQFRNAYKQSGKRLNIGKSCIRFKKFDDLPHDLLKKTIQSLTPEQFVAQYESIHG